MLAHCLCYYFMCSVKFGIQIEHCHYDNKISLNISHCKCKNINCVKNSVLDMLQVSNHGLLGCDTMQ